MSTPSTRPSRRSFASLRAILPVLVLLVGAGVPQVGAPSAHAEEKVPTAKELLVAMDSNLQFESRTVTTTMTVEDGPRTRTYKMVSYGRGKDEAAVEYLEPERDKGTRMLKKDDNMWIYMPRAERVQKISGHMLRQGMMGSDLSYEDMLAQSEFEEMYTATVEGSEDINGRPAWKLVAVAKDATVTYPKRIMWVDKEWAIPVRQELYALSGMMLKLWTMGDVQLIAGKQVATRMEIADQLKKGSKTVLKMEDIQFGVAIEDEVFSLRWLERK